MYSFERIMLTLCAPGNRNVCILFLCTGFIAALRIVQSAEGGLFQKLSGCAGIIASAVGAFLFLSHKLEVFATYETKYSCICFFIFFVSVFNLICFFWHERDGLDILSIAFLLAGCVSLGCMLVSPLIRPRAVLPMFFCLFIICPRVIVDVIVHMPKLIWQRIMLLAFLIIIAATALPNMWEI